MKAVILAGGQGTRLRPLSIKRPKPMLPLFGAPLLSHCLDFLQKSGVDEAIMALKYLPECVTDYFSDYGAMRLGFRVESEALGTAGCVRACSAFLDDEDFLVVSGDAVCDFDLGPALEFHRRRRALATVLLFSSPEPLEYGLVRLGEGGRIAAFTEKPSWGGVYTDLVNTGVYILSPKILPLIPGGVPYDFAKELFPKILADGGGLYGFEARGYWCDVGNCGAYLACAMDGLAGKISFLAPGVHARLPAEAAISGPVYISEDVSVEPGAVVGPNAIITGGAVIGAGARIKNSVVHGGRVGRDSELSGAAAVNAVVGEGASLRPGCVLADGAVLEPGAAMQEQVRVWPEKQVPAGFLLKADFIGELPADAPEPEDGQVRDGVTLSYSLSLGSAAAVFGRVGAAWAPGADIAARAFGCGLRSSGGDAVELDAEFASAAAFAAALYSLPLTAFFDSDFEPAVRFFDKNGLPISREDERRLISALREPAPPSRQGLARQRSGVGDAYAAAAVRSALTECRAAVAVGGVGAASRALKQALKLSGCTVTEPGPGVLCLGVSDGGFSMRARDENGRPVPSSRLLALLAALELGSAGTAAVPDGAPAVLDALAKRMGARLLRPGRDGAEAEKLYISSPFMRDGVFGLVRLLSHLTLSQKTLAAALTAIPDFSRIRREIPLRRGRAEVMRELTKSCAEAGVELSHGLKISASGGSASVSPIADRRSLRLEVECGSAEAAEEFLAGLDKRIRDIDKKSGG